MYGLQYPARLWNDEIGVSSVEYVLLLAFIATAIIAAAESLANAMQNEVTQSVSFHEGDSRQW